MTATVNIHAAKTHFSRLIERALQGDEIIIAKAGRPLVCIVPYHPRHPARRAPGSARGQFTMTGDFEAPLPEKEIEVWEK